MVSLEGKGIAGHLDRKDFQIRAQGEQPYADFRFGHREKAAIC